MAFKHAAASWRRPSRAVRTGARIAGASTLTVGLVAGVFAGSPVAAADSALRVAGIGQAIALGNATVQGVSAQADVQHRAAEAAKAEAAKKARAAKKAKAKKDRAAERAAGSRSGATKAARSAKRAAAFVAPVTGSPVTTQYRTGGSRWSSGSHSGIDFAAASGTPVRATGAGTVVEAGWGGAYGNNIVIRHRDGGYTQYGHLSSMGVRAGQQVDAAQGIGRVGSTGNSTGPHLHFEARTGPSYGSDIDPLAYLRGKGVGL